MHCISGPQLVNCIRSDLLGTLGTVTAVLAAAAWSRAGLVYRQLLPVWLQGLGGPPGSEGDVAPDLDHEEPRKDPKAMLRAVKEVCLPPRRQLAQDAS